jgi:hypothetical protein
MKSDLDYQREFASGDREISARFGVGVLLGPDLARRDVGPVHAGADASSAASKQYNPESSPLAILSRLTGRTLV